jgi:hypothetical protein
VTGSEIRVRVTVPSGPMISTRSMDGSFCRASAARTRLTEPTAAL